MAKQTLTPMIEAMDAISRITRADDINIRVKNGKMTLHGEDVGRSYTVHVDWPSKTEHEFSVSRSAVMASLAKRRDLSFSVRNNRAVFSNAKFEAEIATSPYNERPSVKQELTPRRISKSEQELLLRLMSTVFVPTSVGAPDATFMVKVDKKQTVAACLTAMSAAVTHVDSGGDSLEVCFPPESFRLLLSVAGEAEYNLASTGAALFAWNRDWELVLPFIQSETSASLEQAVSLVGSLGKGQLRCATSELFDALNSTNSIVDIGSDVAVSVSEKSMVLIGESSNGRVKDTVECRVLAKGVTKFKFDGGAALALVGLAPSEFIDLGISGNRLFIKAEADDGSVITYVTVLR